MAWVKTFEETEATGRLAEIYAGLKKTPIMVGRVPNITQRSQLREFEMRAPLDHPCDIIRSATSVNAELLMQQGSLGVIA
ncbi:MAG: metal-dependent hydrolase family protein, partial [Candidatus Binataceae bacterium]